MFDLVGDFRSLLLVVALLAAPVLIIAELYDALKPFDMLMQTVKWAAAGILAVCSVRTISEYVNRNYPPTSFLEAIVLVAGIIAIAAFVQTLFSWKLRFHKIVGCVVGGFTYATLFPLS